MNVRHIRPLDAVARREYHLYLPAKASPSERQTEDASHIMRRLDLQWGRTVSSAHDIHLSHRPVRPKMISSLCVNVNIDLCK